MQTTFLIYMGFLGSKDTYLLPSLETPSMVFTPLSSLGLHQGQFSICLTSPQIYKWKTQTSPWAFIANL